MSIIRLAKHTDKYVILDKAFLEDPNTSLKLKGFLAYCLAKPDHWQFHVNQLSSVLKEGRDAIYSIINEGVESGYIERDQKKLPDGTFGPQDYIVHEISIKKEKPKPDYPYTEKAFTDNPLAEKPTLASIDDSKERSACSASTAPKDGENTHETIFYQGRNRKLMSITRSDIFKHFLGKPYSLEEIGVAIDRFRGKKEVIHDPYKLIDLIIEDVKTTPKKEKKPDYDPATYKPTKLKIPGIHDKNK